jgi:hypothetical protein
MPNVQSSPVSTFLSVASSMFAPERSARARRRHDNPTVVCRAVEDRDVVGFREPVVADVDGVVTDLREPERPS